MFPRIRVPPEEDEEAPPPQPANTRIATTSADISASNLLLTFIYVPSSANNSRGSISGRIAIRGRSESALRPRTYAKDPLPMAGNLRLLFLLRGVDRGLHHVLVVLEPRLDALDRVLRFLDLLLQRGELLLVEPEIAHKRVSHGVIIREILVDYGGDRGRGVGLGAVVEATHGVLRVLEVVIVVRGAVRTRAPGREHEGLLVIIEPLYLCKHRGCARRLVLELEIV